MNLSQELKQCSSWIYRINRPFGSDFIFARTKLNTNNHFVKLIKTQIIKIVLVKHEIRRSYHQISVRS